jgi:tryptophan synthase alpha chain
LHERRRLESKGRTVNRIDATFDSLRQDGRAAFMPFLAAGDPDLETTAAILRALAERGVADLVELGLPYSDPIADGPTIQASYQRALGGGVTPGAILEMLRDLRAGGFKVPVCLMTSYSLVYRPGPGVFVERAAEAGADGLIVPDLPVDEAAALGQELAERNLSHVLLVSPTTPPERRRAIFEHVTGFLYCVSVVGITGERGEMPSGLSNYVKGVKKAAGVPVCVGFGISTAEHVAAVAKLADGAIVGSAIVRRAAEHAGESPETVASAVADLCEELSGPLR